MSENEIIETNDLELVRKLGFPYYQFNDSYLQDFKRLQEQDNKSLLVHNTAYHMSMIKTTSGYSKLASVFFPHMFSTPIVGKKDPITAFNDDKLLTKSIKMAKGKNNRLTRASLRSMLKLVTGVQCVSNFRPEVSKMIYDYYGNEGRIFDFSMGYGGRMVGFLASNCKEYVGVDVNKVNFRGYKEIIKHYNFKNLKKVIPIESPAEEFRPEKYHGYFDCAFSSPPYFHKEMYSEDEDQSYKKYPTAYKWINFFLKPLIFNIYDLLKNDSFFIINIANINEGEWVHDLESPTKIFAEKAGFRLVNKLGYALTILMGTRNKQNIHKSNENVKYEPVFVFAKGNVEDKIKKFYNKQVALMKQRENFSNLFRKN